MKKLTEILIEMAEFISILFKRISIIENFIRNLLLNRQDKIANHILFTADKELLRFFVEKLQSEKNKPSTILNHYLKNEPDFVNSLFDVILKIVIDELLVNKWYMKPNEEIRILIHLRIKSALFSLWI